MNDVNIVERQHGVVSSDMDLESLSKTWAPHVFFQEFGLDHPDTALAEEFLAPWADGKCCGCCDWRCFFLVFFGGVAGG